MAKIEQSLVGALLLFSITAHTESLRVPYLELCSEKVSTEDEAQLASVIKSFENGKVTVAIRDSALYPSGREMLFKPKRAQLNQLISEWEQSHLAKALEFLPSNNEFKTQIIFDLIHDCPYYQGSSLQKKFRAYHIARDGLPTIYIDMDRDPSYWTSKKAQADLVHEFQHAITHELLPNASWMVNEGLSMSVQKLWTGDANNSAIIAFLADPWKRPLDSSDHRDNHDYGKSYFLFQFLMKRFNGLEFINDVYRERLENLSHIYDFYQLDMNQFESDFRVYIKALQDQLQH